MLRWRLLLGTTLVALLAALCWLDHAVGPTGAWLWPLAAVAAWLASGEMLWMLADSDSKPIPWVVYAGNQLIVAANWAGQSNAAVPGGLDGLAWPAAALAIGVVLAFLGEMQRYRGPGGVTRRLASAVFSLVYVGLLLSFVVQLRFLGTSARGLLALLSLVIVVKMCDTGAYTVGRLIGRHKLAPKLSPGKTIEGVAGGLAFGCLGAWLAFGLLAPAMGLSASRPSPAWGWLLFGLIVGAVGIVGDLAESLLKRDLGRKDSSAWMPGFGGVLDVLDSILLGAPAAYLCWTSGLVGL
jgi:phosphatidate cytidylyltransferase